jgi:hypothetical protein
MPQQGRSQDESRKHSDGTGQAGRELLPDAERIQKEIGPGHREQKPEGGEERAGDQGSPHGNLLVA